MLVDRALPLLTTLSRGESVDATPKEILELQGFGLASVADAAALEWAADLQELSKTYGLATTALAREALTTLTGKLRSDVHRMSTRDSVLREEELEVARLRRLVGVLEDPVAATALEAARIVLETKGAKGKTADGRPIVLTPRGYAVALALHARIARYEGKPLSAFVNRFDKAEGGMKQLAEDRAYISSRLDLPKGRDAVTLGLLKVGLPAKEVVQTFETTRSKVRLGPASESAHVAVTLLRNRHGQEPPGAVAARLQQAREALKARRLGNADDLRGSAKVLLAFPDLEAAADRFAELVRSLSKHVLHGRPIKLAARLLSSPGTPAEIVARCATAAHLLSGVEPPFLDDVSIILGASTSTQAEVEGAVARYREITDLLVVRDPDPGELGTCAADLVAYKGTPAEVVDLVMQVLSTLGGGALQAGWGRSPAFETACGFAKRYAY